MAVATWLRRESVPAEDKARVNPVAGDAAAIAGGQELFRQKCEVCHAYDGSGKTEIDAGQYPRPPALSSLNVMELTDGESFYCIRNGIRNTGMPAWPMPDAQLWQLVAYLRHLPHVATLSPVAAGHAATEGAHYVGSVACRSCHTAIYDRWKQTRPKERPDAIIPNLSKPDPLVTFAKDDIAFVYGSKWKQRYFQKVGDDFFPLPAQWDVMHKIWRKYFVPNGADWWAPFYPADNAQRPTGPLCDGCHSVNYDIATKTPTEWNVGCERCHGPGSAHVARPVWDTIVNPAPRLCACERHLHPMPLAGTTPDEPDPWQILRLAGGISRGPQPRRFLEARRAQARQDNVHTLRRRHRPQEPDARQRLRD